MGDWADVPTYGVSVYPVIALPPLLADAAHDTVAVLLPGVAVTFPGAPGTPMVIALDAPAGPLPTPLAATTEKLYVAPLLRPVTVALVAADPALVGACAVLPMYGVIV